MIYVNRNIWIVILVSIPTIIACRRKAHLHTVVKPQYSLAISIILCRPNRFNVVPHVLSISRCGATNNDDSLCNVAISYAFGSERTRNSQLTLEGTHPIPLPRQSLTLYTLQYPASLPILPLELSVDPSVESYFLTLASEVWKRKLGLKVMRRGKERTRVPTVFPALRKVLETDHLRESPL
jgi:hypothetical protein